MQDQDTNCEEFADKLNCAMKDMAIKPVERIPWVAVKMDVTPEDVIKWTNAKSIPHPSMWEKLAVALRKPANFFG
jgi:hypothetical protein